MNKAISIPDYWVELDKRLMGISGEEFGIVENKLLLTYLSRINARDRSTREVVFRKKDFERAIGIKDHIKKDAMLRYTKNMMRPVEVSISPAEKELDPTLVRRLITLFDRSDLREDKDGYKIVMRASESAMEYFFDVEKLGYLKYKLMNVVRLKNMYSIRLFHHCFNNLNLGKWEVSLDKLRQVLCVGNAYPTFKEFRRNVLDPAVADVSLSSDISVAFEAVKKGNRIVKVIFSAERK